MRTLRARAWALVFTLLVFLGGNALVTGTPPAEADAPPPHGITQEELSELLDTHDIYFYEPTFETSGQGMFGPGSGYTPDEFEVTLHANEINLDFSHGRIESLEGEDFGAEATLDADASFGARLRFFGFGPGEVTMEVPAQVWIFVPRKDSFVAGDTVAIRTFLAFGQPNLSTVFPDGQIDLVAEAGLDVSGAIEFCFFSCKSVSSVFPSFDFSQDLPLIPPFNPDTGDLVGSLTPPYTIKSKERTHIPGLVEFITGVGGSYALPDVAVAPTDQTHRTFEGFSDTFIDLRLDLDKYVSLAVKNKVPLSGSTDSINLAGRDLSAEYTIIDVKEFLEFELYQNFFFTPLEVTGTLQFPEAVDYTLRNPDTGAVVGTGTDSTVTFIVGQDIEFVTPDIDAALGTTLIPTFTLSDNRFSQHSNLNYYRTIRQETGALAFHIPGVTVVPAVEVAGEEVTPAVKLDSFDFEYGPEDKRQISLPLVGAGGFEAAAVTSDEWELEGFAAITGDPVTLDPRPGGSGEFIAPASAVQHQGVRFQALAAAVQDGPDLEYLWDFGDGMQLDPSNSTLLNRIVDHVYYESGSYDVTLVVREALSETIRPDNRRSWTSTRTITVDAAPPGVSALAYAGATGDVAIAEGASLADAAVSQLVVTFDEPMNDTPGDTQPGDVTNPEQYLLVRAGGAVAGAEACVPMGDSCATSDQRQVVRTCDISDFEGCGIGWGSGDFGQSFTAGRTGNLTAISVLLNRVIPGTSYGLRLYEGGIQGSFASGFSPSGQLVRSQGVQPAAGWNHLVLAQPLPVTAGETYTFVILGGTIYAPDVSNNGHTYPDGQSLGSSAHDLLFETWVALPTAQPPLGVIGDGTRVPVDAVTYDAETGRATLTVNGGNPLRTGTYRLIARGAFALRDAAGSALDGNGDGTGGDDFVRDFAITSAAPRVVAVGSSTVDRPSGLFEGSLTRAPITDVSVTFNVPVSDPAGDTGADDVTNPANYALVEAGDNGVFNAILCDGPDCLLLDQAVETGSNTMPLSDGTFGQMFHARHSGNLVRVAFAVDSVTSDSATFELYAGTETATTTTGGAIPLPAGELIASQPVTVTPGWNEVVLATPVAVTAGQGYIFRLAGTGDVTAPYANLSFAESFDHSALFSGCCTHLYRISLAGTSSVPGFALLGDDAAISIDGVSYDADAFTATANVNGGEPLPGGDYRLIVRGRTSITDTLGTPLDGNGDGIGGDDFTRTFSIFDPNAGPPIVSAVASTGPDGGEVIDDGDTALLPATGLAVTFNKSVLDRAGHTAFDDVTNPANYRLYRAAADGRFRAVTCAHESAFGLPAVAVDAVSYDDTTHTAALAVNGGAALPDGDYRVIVCGASNNDTAIYDTDGQRLDGFGNGIAGGADFRRDFSLSVSAPAVTGVSVPGADGATVIADGDSLPGTQAANAFRVAFSKPVQDPTGDALATDVTNPAGYAVFFAGPNFVVDSTACGAPAGDDVAVAVDRVTYDGTAATVSYNGGAPLATGAYALVVCGDGTVADGVGRALDGNGDGVAGGDLVLGFNTGGDAVPPRVQSAGWDGGTFSAPPDGPTVIEVPVSALRVTFDASVVDRFGHDDPQDVTNPAHYRLVSAGAGGTPSTSGCETLAAGDQAIAVDGATYDAANDAVTLAVNGGAALRSGAYRLIVCGTGGGDLAIVNASGFPLDGDGDGVPGGDFARDFAVDNVPSTVTGVTFQGVGQVSTTDVPDSIRPVRAAVHFSRSMHNPNGNSGAHDLTNPAHYRLLLPGVGGVFDTEACGPLVGDDAAIAATEADAFNANTGVNIGFAGLGLLVDRWLLAGDYRLEVCASLHDDAGNPLDGDGDAVGGDALAYAFTVVDETPPRVAAVNTVPPAGAALDEDEVVDDAVVALSVRFTEPVLDAAGDTDPHDVTNPANYRVYRADLDGDFEAIGCHQGTHDGPGTIAIDAVTYDAITNTAILSLNGDRRLPDGDYELLVCAQTANATAITDLTGFRLDGFGNGIAGGADFRRYFAVVGAHPVVRNVGIVEDVVHGSLVDGDELPGDVALTEFLVTFDQAMLDAGNANPNSVVRAANYRVVGGGADGVVDTDACGPLVGDDEAFAFFTPLYDSATGTVRLRMFDGEPLPDDKTYRLSACAAIADVHGQTLDGNPDVPGLEDFTLSFSILPHPRTADAELTDLALAVPSEPVLGGATGTVTAEASVTNHGPFGPVEFVVTFEATAPEGCAVEGETSVDVSLTLETAASDVATAEFELTCDAPGDYELEVTADVAPADPDDTPEPDLSNNTGSATAAVTFAGADAETTDLALTAPAEPVAVGEPATLTVDASVVNHGPYGPADFVASIEATPAAGCTIATENPVSVPVTLEADASTPVTAAFDVVCDEPGDHDVDVTVSVAPAAGDVPDANPDNDSIAATAAVSFVLPADARVIGVSGALTGTPAIPAGGGNATIVVTTDVVNLGPAEVADFVVDTAMTAAAGCRVLIAGDPQTVTLVRDTPLSVETEFLVACDEPGDVSFAFTSTVSAAALVVDDDASNDSASASVEARAVSPWAIVDASPRLITEGSNDVLLRLTGDVLAAFDGDSADGLTVRWNGIPLVTTVVDASHVDAVVPAAELASAGGDYVRALVQLTRSARGVVFELSNPLPVWVVIPALDELASDAFVPGETGTVALAPATPDQGGISAEVTSGPGGGDVTVTVASYSANPVDGIAFGAGGGFVDLRIEGADGDDSAAVSFYYPASVTGASEEHLELWYFDGVEWHPVLGAGGASPLKDTSDNLDGTVSGGRFTVTFDATSAPAITALTGTVFAMTVPDGTPPETVATVTGTEGNDGWFIVGDPVVVTLTATDEDSGVASTTVSVDGGPEAPYTAPLTLTDGVHSLTYFSTDEVGNVEEPQSLTVQVDQSPPAIDAERTPDANAHGWNNGDVTVTFTCSDDPVIDGVEASGLASCDGNATLTDETAGESVTGTATDVAGNTATVTVDDIRIDRTPPAVTAEPSPAANDAGWHAGPVTIAAAASDALSGVDEATCTTVTLDAEGVDGAATVHCDDRAGNRAEVTVEGIQIDRTAPETGATVDGPAGDDGWFTGPVTVTLEAADALSGVAGIAVSVDDGAWQPYEGPLTFADDGRHTLRFRATDVAGNEEAERELEVAIDQASPATSATVSGTPGNDGWFIAGSPVQLTLEATDATSGVGSTWYRIGGGTAAPYGGPVSLPGGEYVVAYWSVDRAGNAEAEQQLSVRVDMTPPEVTVTGVEPGGTYVVGGVAPSCEATDPGAAGSGLAGSCEGVLQAPATATGAGTYSYTATASDVAGNTTTVTVSYQLVYAFGGFEPPVADGGTYTVGQAIPVKFELRDADGRRVSGAAATVMVNGTPAATNGNAGGGARYHVNVDTSGVAAGPATIAVVLDDGQTYAVTVELVAKPDKGKKDKDDKKDKKQDKGKDRDKQDERGDDRPDGRGRGEETRDERDDDRRDDRGRSEETRDERDDDRRDDRGRGEETRDERDDDRGDDRGRGEETRDDERRERDEARGDDRRVADDREERDQRERGDGADQEVRDESTRGRDGGRERDDRREDDDRWGRDDRGF